MHKKEKVNSNYKKNYLNTTNYLFNPSIQNADSIYHAPPPPHTHTQFNLHTSSTEENPFLVSV